MLLISAIAFDAAAVLTAGTYAFTATAGETKVNREEVAEITIPGKEALTDDDNRGAYINYDVVNQCCESICFSYMDFCLCYYNGAWHKMLSDQIGDIVCHEWARYHILSYNYRKFLSSLSMTP